MWPGTYVSLIALSPFFFVFPASGNNLKHVQRKYNWAESTCLNLFFLNLGRKSLFFSLTCCLAYYRAGWPQNMVFRNHIIVVRWGLFVMYVIQYGIFYFNIVIIVLDSNYSLEYYAHSSLMFLRQHSIIFPMPWYFFLTREMR